MSSLWRHRDFMRLWTGQTISQLGSQITLLALPLAAILIFRANPFELGLLGTLEFLPFLLFGLPVGVWVDRLRRKPILVIADVARFVILGSIPLAHALDALHLEHLYVAAFATGVCTVFFDVAYAAYLPSLINRRDLVEGNAKLEISRSGAQLAGPGLAGLLVDALKAPVAILADAVSYLGSVVFLVLIRRREPPVEPPPLPPSLWTQVAEGLGYVFRHELLRPLITCTALLNLASGVHLAVLLAFAVRSLGLTPGRIGAVLTLGNLGFLAGAVLAGRTPRWIGVGPTLVGAALLIGLDYALLAFATRAAAVPVLLVAGLIGSFGGAHYNVNARSLVQSLTPERMLGRTIATARFVVWGTIPLGSFLGGILGSRIGLRPTLFVSGAIGLAAFLFPALSRLRGLREMPTLPVEPSDVEGATR